MANPDFSPSRHYEGRDELHKAAKVKTFTRKVLPYVKWEDNLSAPTIEVAAEFAAQTIYDESFPKSAEINHTKIRQRAQNKLSIPEIRLALVLGRACVRVYRNKEEDLRDLAGNYHEGVEAVLLARTAFEEAKKSPTLARQSAKPPKQPRKPGRINRGFNSQIMPGSNIR